MRRRLDTELVRRGLADSRTSAQRAIDAGRVLVSGARADRAARLVQPGEPIALSGPPARFVSRGGEKLDAALSRFGIDVKGCRCLDAGASTGGFTDCLLQRGAASVAAVDVGSGQLAWSLRTDPRVEFHERTNVRFLDPATIGGPFDVVVGDLSFISLRLVAPALALAAGPGAEVVLLIKPQFEAGRDQVPRGGVVTDADVHLGVLRTVSTQLATAGLVMTAVMASPLRGGSGNTEFLGRFRLPGDAEAILGNEELVAAVVSAVEEDRAR